MYRIPRTAIRWLPLPLLLFTATACAGMGTLDDLLGMGGVYGTNREVSGSIRSIDTRRQEIQLESAWRGSQRVRYDNRTQVISGNRRYSVRDLRRGDRVQIWVDQDRRGQAYASRITLQQNTQSRGGGQASARIQRLDGSVGRLDLQRGWFELHPNRGSVVLVTLPYEPSRNLRDRFRRLRQGERIRIEGQMLNSSRVELQRFL